MDHGGTGGTAAGRRGARLIMWDIDRTLMRADGVAAEAFLETVAAMTGLPATAAAAVAWGGRTDLDTATELFAAHGVAEPDYENFFARYAAAVELRRELMATRARVLPGAAEALAALSGRPGVVQTVVTGNIRPVAEIKLHALGLAAGIDFEVGGYGTDDGVRATLVRRSRERAHAKYGAFVEVVVVGDTPLDVAGALANGVIAVGVATGGASATDLKAAGAHHVLDSLSDTGSVVRLLAG